MDAIKFLMQQHREVSATYKLFQECEEEDEQQAYFEALADDLTVHAAIEERWFYPAVRVKQTHEELVESVEEHLEIKKLVIDAMSSMGEPGFDGKVAALMGAVEHHVEEEESRLFPQVRQLLSQDELNEIGERLEADAERIKEQGAPRIEAKVETELPSQNL